MLLKLLHKFQRSKAVLLHKMHVPLCQHNKLYGNKTLSHAVNSSQESQNVRLQLHKFSNQCHHHQTCLKLYQHKHLCIQQLLPNLQFKLQSKDLQCKLQCRGLLSSNQSQDPHKCKLQNLNLANL